MFFPFLHHNFLSFLDHFDLKLIRDHEKSKKIVRNRTRRTTWNKNLILANSQYLSSENYVFKDPLRPEFNENLLEFPEKQTADASNKKNHQIYQRRAQIIPTFAPEGPQITPNNTRMVPK